MAGSMLRKRVAGRWQVGLGRELLIGKRVAGNMLIGREWHVDRKRVAGNMLIGREVGREWQVACWIGREWQVAC